MMDLKENFDREPSLLKAHKGQKRAFMQIQDKSNRECVQVKKYKG